MSLITTTVMCLALNVYKEARGEPEIGQLAVAQVTLNRASKQQKTVCEVVYARKQFSWTNTDIQNGRIKKSALPDFKSRAWKASVALARRALGEKDWTGGATYYHASQIRPYWAVKLAYVGQWGNHLFYREA